MFGRKAEKEVDEAVVKKIVDWWADKISGNYHHDNGDSSEASVMACLMADIGRKPVTEEQLAIFKDELSKRVREEAKGGYWGRVFLDCDYGPSMILSESAEAAGINVLNFPFKTGMMIKEDGSVWVSDGYAKAYEKI